MTCIISIISLIVSIIAALVPIYYQYFQKKEKIVLTACSGIIRGSILKIPISYLNKNWRNALLVNSHLQLHYSDSRNLIPQFTKENHYHGCKWMEPILLKEKSLTSLILEYELPSLKDLDVNKIEVYVYIDYINAQGVRMSQSINIGVLCCSEQHPLVLIESIPYEVEGQKIIASMDY